MQVNDQIHGQGVLTDPDGTVHHATFEHNQRRGPGIVIYTDGLRLSVVWGPSVGVRGGVIEHDTDGLCVTGRVCMACNAQHPSSSSPSSLSV
jgi:hypothetical protein